MSAILKQITEFGFVPLLALNDARDAVPLGQALSDGGLPIAEISCVTSAGSEAIRRMARSCPGLLLGAGGVHSIRQVREAVDGGARFISTPGFSPGIIGYCQAHAIPVLPAAAVPADLRAALECGLHCIRFPVSGPHGSDAGTLRGLSASCPGLRFVPSGGIGMDSLQEYLDLPGVAAVASSCAAPLQHIAERDWDGIARICRHIMRSIFDFRISGVGLQAEPGGGAGAPERKASGDGPLGSISVETRDMVRALAMFRRSGVQVEEGSEARDDQGRVTSIRIRDEAGGFVFSLHQRRLSA